MNCAKREASISCNLAVTSSEARLTAHLTMRSPCFPCKRGRYAVKLMRCIPSLPDTCVSWVYVTSASLLATSTVQMRSFRELPGKNLHGSLSTVHAMYSQCLQCRVNRGKCTCAAVTWQRRGRCQSCICKHIYVNVCYQLFGADPIPLIFQVLQA